MDISETARRLAGVPRRTIAVTLDAPEQVARLLDQTTGLMRRATQLMNRVDLIVARLEHKLDEFDALTAHSDALLEKAGVAAGMTQSVAEEVRNTRELAEQQLQRVQGLLDLYQPILQSLAPMGKEALGTLNPSYLRGIVSLLNELPNWIERVEPALDGMGNLAPHLEGVTNRMDNVGQVVEGLPGAKLLRRRGQAREEEAE